MEPQRHKATKKSFSFPLWLCAFVVQVFQAFCDQLKDRSARRTPAPLRLSLLQMTQNLRHLFNPLLKAGLAGALMMRMITVTKRTKTVQGGYACC